MYLLEQYFPIMILKLYADYFHSPRKCLLKFKTQTRSLPPGSKHEHGGTVSDF